MKKNIFNLLVAVMMLLLATSCSMTRNLEADAVTVPYIEMRNYYVLNDYEHAKVERKIIKNEEEFSKVFGEAAFMGVDGEPTIINFKKQFVLAVLLPETATATNIYPLSVLQNGNAVIFNYKVERGEKQSYTTNPFTAVVLDRPIVDAQLEFYFNEK